MCTCFRVALAYYTEGGRAVGFVSSTVLEKMAGVSNHGSCHLLLLLQVGYNNAENYWVARNSWGQGFADAGYFKVGRGLEAQAHSRCCVTVCVTRRSEQGSRPPNEQQCTWLFDLVTVLHWKKLCCPCSLRVATTSTNHIPAMCPCPLVQ